MFDNDYRGRMPRQPTELQLKRAEREAKALTDAGWALRRLADQRRYQGAPPYLAYTVCAVLEGAARNIDELSQSMRHDLLRVAEAIARDVREDAAASKT
jgi:hypothetical protein